jgi:Tfp pilus assembly PilM family ATPase
LTGYGNHAGFNITSSKIQLVEINYKESGYILQNIDEVYFDERLKLSEDKETKVLSVLQAAFNEILLRNQLKSKTASFTLPPEIFYNIQIPYDNTLLSQDLMMILNGSFQFYFRMFL